METCQSKEIILFPTEILSFYEQDINSIGSIFFDSHQLLNSFKKDSIDLHEEREILKISLCDKLAKNESLRRKDFNQMLQSILEEQNNREKEVKNLLENYLIEQRQMARGLKKYLVFYNQKIQEGEQIRLDKFKQKFARLKKQNLERQNQVKELLIKCQEKFVTYHEENEKLFKGIKELLNKGEEIRIEDFKAMIKKIQEEREESKNALGIMFLKISEER